MSVLDRTPKEMLDFPAADLFDLDRRGVDIADKRYGGDPTGTVDSSQAILSALSNASDAAVASKGIYLITQNISISSSKLLSFGRNARLKPANGVTITIDGSINANPNDWIFDLSLGGKIAGKIKTRSIYPEWFGANRDGNDDTFAIQTALDVAFSAGVGVVELSSGVYAYTQFTIPNGVFIRGQTEFVDSIQRYTAGPLGTTLVPRDLTKPSIIMHGGTNISKVCWYYENQKKQIANESEALNSYPPTIQLGDASHKATGVTIKDFVLLGASKFIEQYSYSDSCEKIKVENGYGWFTETFMNLKKCTDIPRVTNVHMNLNSSVGWLTGNSVPYYTKLAKTAVMFKLARVDEIIVTNCFAYGVKHLIHFYKEDPADDGHGGGATLVGTSVDVCHQAFRIERSHFGFGIKVIGGFFTPLVAIAGSEQALVYFGGDSKFTRVHFTAIRCFGGPVSQVTGSKSTDYIVVFDTTGTANAVLIEGTIAQYTTALTKNEDRSNTNTLIFLGTDKESPNAILNVASIRDLTVANALSTPRITVTDSRIFLNHPLNDFVRFRVNGTTDEWNVFALQQHPDYGAIVQSERYLRKGNLSTLPAAASGLRGLEVRVEGGSGVADKVVVCVKKADNSYGWFDKISGTFVT